MQSSASLCGIFNPGSKPGISTQINEVNDMTEPKLKPVAKKAATAKAGSVAAGKQKTVKAAVAKNPAVKKAAAKKTTAAVTEPKKSKTPVIKKTLEKKTPVIQAKPAVPNKRTVKPSPEERYRMVETAAYFIAEQHGFQGRSDEHWVAAERQIAAKLGQ